MKNSSGCWYKNRNKIEKIYFFIINYIFLGVIEIFYIFWVYTPPLFISILITIY